ncbi:hypothetical protein Tco_1268233 [Tanacetum coccineum]
MILHSSVSDDQINSDIISDDPNVEVNSDSVEHDKNAHASHDNELEQLARNAYKEAEKQQILAQKVKQQNVTDKIRAWEKERDDLQLHVSEQRKQVLELQTAQTSLKRKLIANEGKYLDVVLNLEAKLKKNENMVIKMSNSVQALFMLGPKPLLVYDPQLKHGLGYENPYTLKQAIYKIPKLYDASYTHSSKVHVNVYDTEEILKDATKKTFVPQVELSLEQIYFPSASTFFETSTSASTSSSPPVTMPSSSKLHRHFHMLENEIQKLYTLLKTKTTPKSIVFTSREDTILKQFCYQEVTLILDYLHKVFIAIQTVFPEEVKAMMDVFVSMESDLDETL